MLILEARLSRGADIMRCMVLGRLGLGPSTATHGEDPLARTGAGDMLEAGVLLTGEAGVLTGEPAPDLVLGEDEASEMVAKTARAGRGEGSGGGARGSGAQSGLSVHPSAPGSGLASSTMLAMSHLW